MRCSTISGPYRCDLHDGHSGECETRQEAREWVGPAVTQLQLHDTITTAAASNASKLRLLEKKLKTASILARLPYIVSPLRP